MLKKVRNFAIILCCLFALLALFQNFRWYDLVRGGPGEESFEIYDLDRQIDWMASIQSTLTQIDSNFDELKAYAIGRIKPVTVAAPTQESVAVQYITESYSEYMNRIISREQWYERNPIFYLMQDDTLIKSRLPTSSFAIRYGSFSNEILIKGNEEHASAIREWRLENMFVSRFVANGGHRFALLKEYGDPTPALNKLSELVNQINSGTLAYEYRVPAAILKPLPTNIKTSITSEAEQVKQLLTEAQSAYNRYFLANFNMLLVKKYSNLIDGVLEKYQLLGFNTLTEFKNKFPLAYNGEDINPILFDYALSRNIGSIEEYEEYMTQGPLYEEGITTPEILKARKTELERDFGATKLSSYRPRLDECISVYNSIIDSLPVDVNQLANYLIARQNLLAYAKNKCRFVVPIKKNSMFFLSRLGALTGSHLLYLEYALKQKEIEDKYALKLKSIEGTDLGSLLKFIETNIHWIDKDFFSIPEVEGNYASAINFGNDGYTIFSDRNGKQTGNSDSVEAMSILDVPPEAFRQPEFQIDLPSTLRRLAMTDNAIPLTSDVRYYSALILKDLLEYKKIFDCKNRLESAIDIMLKSFYEKGQFSDMTLIIRTLKYNDPQGYCTGLYISTEGSRDHDVSIDEVQRHVQETIKSRYHGFIGGKMRVQRNIDSLLKLLVANRVLYRPAQPVRTTGSYFSDPCGKAVLPWKNNSNYSAATRLADGTEIIYKLALNPQCYGIEGGIKLPVRKKCGSDGYKECNTSIAFTESLRKKQVVELFRQIERGVGDVEF